MWVEERAGLEVVRMQTDSRRRFERSENQSVLATRYSGECSGNNLLRTVKWVKLIKPSVP